MSSVLEVVDLTKSFSGKKPFTAVDGISFQVKEGEVVGLLGPNGAGKSTTIHMLLGTLTPTKGEIYYFGENFRANRSKALERVGYVNGYSKLPWNLTVEENLQVFGRLAGLDRGARRAQIEKMLRSFDCYGLRKKLMSTLSAGQATRVMLAKAFLGNPRMVLLDEPTAALDPEICAEVRAFVKRQRKEHGVSMIYTSHNMSEVSEICDRVIFLKNGRITAVDTPDRLARTVARSTLRVRVECEIPQAYASVKALYADAQSRGGWIEMSLENEDIASALHGFGNQGIKVADVEVIKPTLEDYFLRVAAQDKREM